MVLLGTDKKKRLERVYGPEFPGLKAKGDEWKSWIKKQFAAQESFRRDSQMHYSRYDNFRAGKQWISTRDGKTWREPNTDKAQLRPVMNMIGPALDFRLGLILEQRPGFRIEPLISGTAGRETAEAQQSVAEYEFYRQRAWLTFLDAMFWAQTHGVAFVHVYVDKSGGPEREDVELIPQNDDRYADLVALGYEVDERGNAIIPLDESGNYAAPNVETRMISEGVLRSRVVLASETLTDPEARTLNGPIDSAKWFMTRRLRDIRNARLETGNDELEAESQASANESEETQDLDMRWVRGIPSFPVARAKRLTESVYEYNVYIAPDKNGLPNGGWIKLVGNEVVNESEEELGLPGGVIPFARFTDGTSDPQLYPRPIVSEWIGDNISINAMLASLLQHARTVGVGRVLSQKNTVLEETYSKIVGSLLEYQGQAPQIVSGSSASRDTWELLSFLVKQLENKSGWSDLARGQVSQSGGSSMQDVSGRALLGAKELFERTFGPPVRAAAEGASEWAHIVIKYAQEIYDTPRLIPSVGRPDLAKAIDKSMLGTKPVVYVDPETLMPLPRALRQQMLFDHWQNGLITMDQYRQRAPYAEIRDLTMGDTEQVQRAQWVNTVIEERYEELVTMPPEVMFSPEGLPILWQDDPLVHKTALNELILNERKPWTYRKLASDRWAIYDQLEQAKANPMMPVPIEVIGTPGYRLIAPAPVVVGNGGGASETAAMALQGQQPGQTTSPTPDMSQGTQAGQLTPQPLGSYGAVEEEASANQES